jgi:Kef-type K+ transport system membrane component KefB
MQPPVAPIPAHELLLFLLQLALLLGVAIALGRLAAWVRLPTLVGELGAGLLLGPSIFGHIAPGLSAWLLPHDAAQFHLVDAVGQLGVVLLVGLTALHLDPGELRRRGATAAWVSGGGVIVPLGLGIALGFILPAVVVADGTNRVVFALFVGVALCVSAIPVIGKILLEMRLIGRDIGQLIVGASVIDDVVGWILLSVVAAMATGGAQASQIGRSVLAVLAVALLTVLCGRPLARLTLRTAARADDAGVSVATVVAMFVLCAAGSHALGLEPVLGAFAAGIAVALSGEVSEAWRTPLRTLVMAVLAPLFFATAGLRMDLSSLARPMVLLAALAVILVAVLGKFAGAYLGARTGRLSHWEGLALGAGLNTRGIIEVVVATVGLRLGVLNAAAYTIVLMVALVTSVMAPPILRYAISRLPVTQHEQQRERALAGV